MEMDLAYGWTFREPGERLGLQIVNHERDGGILFEAALALRRRELSPRSRARMLVRYPLITLQIVTAIYWQALRLALAGAASFPHPRARSGALERSS
jgi:DUF1365 family protein